MAVIRIFLHPQNHQEPAEGPAVQARHKNASKRDQNLSGDPYWSIYVPAQQRGVG